QRNGPSFLDDHRCIPWANAVPGGKGLDMPARWRPCFAFNIQIMLAAWARRAAQVSGFTDATLVDALWLLQPPCRLLLARLQGRSVQPDQRPGAPLVCTPCPAVRLAPASPAQEYSSCAR